MVKNDYFDFSLSTALFPKSWRQPGESDEGKIRRAVSSLYSLASAGCELCLTIPLLSTSTLSQLLANILLKTRTGHHIV